MVNSTFKDSIAAHKSTFTDWSAGSMYPRVITHTHIQGFVKKRSELSDDARIEWLFARKFPDDSEALVQAIRADLW